MVEISSFAFRLAPSQVNWSESHARVLSKDYPFADLASETADMYIQRTYLQFLWLPESIMPLTLLIPSLLRVNIASSSQPTTHPLHVLVSPLLLTGRLAANKYHTDLPQLLSDGGGDGEIEETMMWYALSNEKADESRGQSRPGSSERAEELWMNEKWRAKWLERMERREVLIQILLHLLLLSLPGPPPPPSESPSRKRKKQSPRNDTARTVNKTTEDRLEAFMDKLSMWQLINIVEQSSASSKDDKENVLDWIQRFFRDVVEPQFKTSLPDQCSLLHSKIFRTSIFSDDETTSRSSSRSPSPESQPPKELLPRPKRARTSTADNTRDRHPSPALSVTSSSAREVQPRSLARSRSRSLSVSLAQEKERERAESVGTNSKKRVLNREVSMSMVFKGKPKPKVKETHKEQPKPMEPKPKNEGVTLVEATPVKPKPPKRLGLSRVHNTQTQTASSSSLFSSKLTAKDEEEEVWDLPSSESPDILLLKGTGSQGDIFGSDDEDAAFFVPVTPTKGRK
ncbi:uncharacterized protein BT62DRAFT_993235 [Guyanagaster necrorhizus]|uniref:DNA replication regulator Sld3 C-terminal domain-containing protein n=1 Tax=Guyanagaster necrorhizus TaxID=856835 RepID=A0A9P7VW58_9AGAR|nr:uncharacterized protein BT62DRAFT_993235 [Guyanagaster necrorhizus MCA 3950]KAG7447555.1 hypothetical protein BT62DRAFT_993235 [Guyanagaster necrorhizus MCA 3950]